MTKRKVKPYAHYAAVPRHKTGISVMESAWAYVKARAEEWGLSNNASVERIIIEHQVGIAGSKYQSIIEAESRQRRRCQFLRKIERLVQEIKEMEEDRDAAKEVPNA